MQPVHRRQQVSYMTQMQLDHHIKNLLNINKFSSNSLVHTQFLRNYHAVISDWSNMLMLSFQLKIEETSFNEITVTVMNHRVAESSKGAAIR